VRPTEHPHHQGRDGQRILHVLSFCTLVQTPGLIPAQMVLTDRAHETELDFAG
jgi:hypothetical protein